MRASILSFSVILVALAAAPSCATRSHIPDESNGSGGDAASSSGAGGQGGGGGVGGQGGMGGAGGQGGQGGAGGGGQGGAGGGSGMACGGFVGSVCGPTEFCDSPDKIACFPDAPGMCVPRPGSACPPDCPQVCGCDGKTYCSMCEANNAGFDALPGGPCK